MNDSMTIRVLKRVLNKKEPVDRLILELVENNELTVCFVKIPGGVE